MLNQCSFIGNLGRDAEIRTTQEGKEIATLSLGVSEKWKTASGERKERTEWVRVSIFNEGLVKVVKQYTRKGSKLYVQGKLQTRKWTDKDGQERYSTEIVLGNFGSTLVLLDSAKAENKPDYQSEADSIMNEPRGDAWGESEIPF